MDKINLERIDTQLSSTLCVSDAIVLELNNQTEKINNMNNKLYLIQKYINVSKCMYKMITSWTYKLDYFDIYNKYLNYSSIQPELIEMDEMDEIDETPNIIEIEDNVVNKLVVLKKHAIFINELLNKQNEALENITQFTQTHTCNIKILNTTH